MAESEGFEPSKGALPPYSLSRRAPSTDSASSPYTCDNSGPRTRVVIVPAWPLGVKQHPGPCYEPGRCGALGLASGGGGGIRTLGRVAPSIVFKTIAINHSATPPRVRMQESISRCPHPTSAKSGVVLLGREPSCPARPSLDPRPGAACRPCVPCADGPCRSRPCRRAELQSAGPCTHEVFRR